MKRVRFGRGYPCGWWDEDEFKYVPAGAGMGLKFSPVMSGGAEMWTGILCGCGYGCGGTIL